MENSNRCPRCDGGRLRRWDELNDDEREVVKRLPASADYSLDGRKARHRWCARCWYEETSGSPTLV
jgi:hypothetical protein